MDTHIKDMVEHMEIPPPLTEDILEIIVVKFHAQAAEMHFCMSFM